MHVAYRDRFASTFELLKLHHSSCRDPALEDHLQIKITSFISNHLLDYSFAMNNKDEEIYLRSSLVEK